MSKDSKKKRGDKVKKRDKKDDPKKEKKSHRHRKEEKVDTKSTEKSKKKESTEGVTSEKGVVDTAAAGSSKAGRYSFVLQCGIPFSKQCVIFPFQCSTEAKLAG